MKKKTFKVAKQEINTKYPYLLLLEFNGNEMQASFLDKEYGNFKGIYRSVLKGSKSHPERSRVNRREKTKKTNLEKYGVEYPAQNKDIYNKVKQTNLERYGVEYSQQNKEIKEKTKKSILEKYGVKHHFKIKEIKDKYYETNLKKYGTKYPSQNIKIKKKVRQTNLERYGVKYPAQNKDIFNEVKKTNLEKYGVENISQLQKIKDKVKKTNLEKYGVEHPSQNKCVKEKYKKTNIKKYNVEYPAQNKKIMKKIRKTNLKNGNWYNISGMSLLEYYNNSELNKFGYSTIQQNYKKYGNKALEIEHYNILYRKSKIANLWLEQIEKELGYELIREYHISTTRYHADGYDPKTNTVYEFYGDYWHGNLNKYSAGDIHPIKEKTYQELYNDTIERESKINSLGYNIIFIWENNFKV